MSGNRLEGKVAIITGAAGGIGAATATQFASEGAVLVLTDLDAERVAAVAAQFGERASSHAHDVSRESDWYAITASVLEAHGRIDVLVNNAGMFIAAPLVETAAEDFMRVLEVNVLGVFLGMRAVAPAMGERRAGSIINISSIAGMTGGPYLTAYGASKWAVRGMTKVAAIELARSGVRVTSVHPGQIDTDMHRGQAEKTPELVDKLIRTIPMRHLGDPADIARALVYLASDESAYVTGAELAVDGGQTA